jgi:hypothetical protein
MAEDKKTFLQGKMNQDIDDRILPNGEYRSAQNIQVTTSEGSDVGSIQNIPGNSIINNPKLSGFSNLKTIGSFFDETNNRIFYFVTNYNCPTPFDTGLVGASDGPETADQFALRTGDNLFCGIFMATDSSSISSISIKTIASGLFFNFSKTHLITGVNLIEDLLFFTDGLNQPRKINVSTAITEGENYYDREDKISVAKFAPFMPPLLLDYDTTTLNGNPQVTTTDSFGNVTNVPPTSSMEVSSQNSFPEDLLKEKFVRFSYRYRFVDGEYSTIAPFTQICFIPKTKSYNITQLQKVFKKGEVYFQDNNGISDGMVNDVNAVNLNIILPSKKIKNDFDINAIEILYKESDNNLIRAVELIDLKDSDSVDGVFQYKYKSTLPYKTLPQDQLTRVYDNVPLNAKAQEIISNRVVYGNYVEQRKLPNQDSGSAGLNFSVGSTFKHDTENFAGNSDFNNYYLHKEYPLHSIKQRRTYEVGIVLSDKFGRQSPVLTSTSGVSSVEVSPKSNNFNSSSWDIGDSTDVNSSGGVIVPEISPGDENYCGDALSITFNEKVPNAYAESTFIPINENGISTVTYANNVFKTIFATDPLLQGGGLSGTGILLGELFYYSGVSYGRVHFPGASDFLYLDATLQNVLTGYNEVYLRYSVNTHLVHKVSLNFSTGAIEAIDVIQQNEFQSNLIGPSAPVNVGSAGDIVNTTDAVTVVTPNQIAITSGDFSGMFRLFIENFTQTDLFQVGDYLKGQDTDFVIILSIESSGGNLSLYTEGPASLLYQNYTGDPASPVFTNVDTYIFYKYNLIPHGWYSYRVVVKQPEQEYYNVYSPGAVSFDNDQDEDKTYIPISSDSINKITRDVEFTSTQEEGLSTSKNRVYPKVVPDGDALSKQSDADLLDVISIGTAKEQGLKNDNEDVFAFVYESSKNTLMAQLPYGNDGINVGTATAAGFVGTVKTITSTNEISGSDTPDTYDIKLKSQGKILTWTDSNHPVVGYEKSFTIGSYLKGANKDLVKIIKFHDIGVDNVVKVECDSAIDKVSLGLDTEEVPATIDVRIYDYKYGTQDKISVFETKPFESVLDIYYETSTAGLVHELNEIVDFPTTTKVVNLINKNFSEDVQYFDSNNSFLNQHVAELQLIDQFGNELTAGPANSQISACTIISEQAFYHEATSSDLAGTYVDSSVFEIILDSNTNKFKIKPVDGQGNFVYHPETEPVKYRFSIQITNNLGESETIIKEIELENASPDATQINSVNLVGSEGLVVYDFLEQGAHNGSIDEDQRGLFFVNDGIDGTNNSPTFIGFVENEGTTLAGTAGASPFDGDFNLIRENQILIDINTGDPIPELILNNQTGQITLTSLFRGTLIASVLINVIDSDDTGIIETGEESQNTHGGKLIPHTLSINVNDGLIVLEAENSNHIINSNAYNILAEDGVSTNHIFGGGITNTELSGIGSNLLQNTLMLYNNYWTHFPTEAQQDQVVSQFTVENAGVFLYSNVTTSAVRNSTTITQVKELYALKVINGVPKIVRYNITQTGEKSRTYTFFRYDVYFNNWIGKEELTINTNDNFRNQPGGFISRLSYAGGGSYNIVSTGYGLEGGGDSRVVNEVEDVDSIQQYWKPDEIFLSDPYGNRVGTSGYFAVYGNGENVSTGVAIQTDRSIPPSGNSVQRSRNSTIKAKDTIRLGGFDYNILYDLKRNAGDNQTLLRVFLCRVQD